MKRIQIKHDGPILTEIEIGSFSKKKTSFGIKDIMEKKSASTGIGLGGLLAALLSWVVNHSIGWCILHFFCGWIYVIYWAIEYRSRF